MRSYYVKHINQSINQLIINPFSPARNVVEAASNGAMQAVKVVASVAANLIAILGLIAFLDAMLNYLGSRVGYADLDFQVRRLLICLFALRNLLLSVACKLSAPSITQGSHSAAPKPQSHKCSGIL